MTSCQVGKKFDVNPTVKWFKPTCDYGDDGNFVITEGEKVDSNQQLARQVGESKRQIARYIRLTYLIPKILSMVDDQKIAFTVGVELSYLSEEEQYELYAVMDLEQATPSLSQANRLKIKSQQGVLDMDLIYEILGEEWGVRTKIWTTIGLRKEFLYVFPKTKINRIRSISPNKFCI